MNLAQKKILNAYVAIKFAIQELDSVGIDNLELKVSLDNLKARLPQGFENKRRDKGYLERDLIKRINKRLEYLTGLKNKDQREILRLKKKVEDLSKYPTDHEYTDAINRAYELEDILNEICKLASSY
jgi:hypothetical protein